MSSNRMAAWTLAALAATGAAAAQDAREIRRDLPLAAGGRVSIDTYKGSVSVTGWDQPRVEIVARIEPSNDEPDQPEKVRLTDVRIEDSGAAVRITTDYGRLKEKRRSLFGWDDTGVLPRVHYIVRMPRRAAFQLKDHKSQIDVRGLDGEIDLDSYKGVVDIEGTSGLRLKTYKGEVRARFDRLERESAFETYKGEITVELPARAAFDLDVDAGDRGDIDNDFTVGVRVADRGKDGTRLNGPVNGGGPALRLETHKGSFRIRRR